MIELCTDAIEACIYGNETGEIDEFGFPEKIMKANRQLNELQLKIKTQEMAIKVLIDTCDEYRTMIANAIKTGNRVSQ
jgi:hypothetical protein